MSFKLVRHLFLKIDNRQRYGLRVFDYLHRLIVDSSEDRPQALVPAYDFIEASLKRRDIQRAGESNCGGNVVRGIARFQLVQKPKSLLRKRQRHRSRLRARENAAVSRRGNSLPLKQ
jgi:hypothetical protein